MFFAYARKVEQRQHFDYRLAVVAAAMCFVRIELGWAADIQANSRAEAWVLKRVLAGQVADLADPSAHLPKASDRVLSVSFLERLLTDPSQSVKVHRRGVDIEHAVFQEEIDLRFAKVPYPVSLTACEFLNKVDLSYSVFEKNLSFSEGTFTEANFNRMKVGGDAFFNKAEFAGPVDFRGANIASQFQAHEAHFTNAEQVANFNGMKVGDMATFKDVLFAGPVNFGGANITGAFQIDGATFSNPKQVANFNGMKVGGMATLNKVVFAGTVDFVGANITGQFQAEEAKFTNSKQEANFNSMKVGGSALFNKAEFAGPVDFRGANIASQFQAHEAHFTNAEQAATFNGMQVGDIAWFEKTEFRGAFSLGDMTYRGIRVNKDTDQDWWKSLITLVNRSRYNAATYTNLEDFLKRTGYPDYADEVFIAQKWRERDETLPWYTFGYWWNWFLYCLVAYGREPSRAFVACIVFIVAGYLIFRRPEQMEPQQEYPGEPYSPFWYSLGLFLPFVNLYAAEVWRPKKECRWARIYMRVHILFGWILVPLGLAAVTGLIK